MDPKLKEELSQILDVKQEAISTEILLDDCQWDSISAVQFITTIDLLFDVKINPKDLTSCQTIGDLIRLIAI